jgi:outer membrane protein TolC
MKTTSILFVIMLFHLCLFSQGKRLEDYIQTGIQNSPLLKDYSNQQLVNLVDSLRIIAGYKPQIAGVSTNRYAPTVRDWGYDGAITNGSNFSELITVNKRLVSKENVGSQNEAIRLLNESLTLSGKVTELDLKKSITTQYITAYGNWQQYQFNNELLSLLKKEESILKSLAEKGVYRQTDYLSFIVTIHQQELLISQVRIQFNNEFATLNYLSGIKDTAATALAEPQLGPISIAEAENTVFYHQYQVDSLKFKNNDAQIEYSYKPKVDLYADVGYLSSLNYQPYKNFGVSAGVTVTVPIYDGRQKKMQHDKIAIAEQTRQSYRDFFKKQYDQQVAQLSQQLQSTQQLIMQASEQIRYTEALMDANRKLLETGDVRMADYILAISNYLTAKNIVIQNTVNKLQLINQINYWNRK